MLKVVIHYPKKEEELMIIRQNTQQIATPTINPVVSMREVMDARDLARTIYMDEKIENYILDLVFATRKPEQVGLSNLKPLLAYGGSPRASINMALASKSVAFINKRGYVLPEDVRTIAADVLRHRIGLTYEAEAENISVEEIIKQVLNTVKVP